jgi:hypothetical protein
LQRQLLFHVLVIPFSIFFDLVHSLSCLTQATADIQQDSGSGWDVRANLQGLCTALHNIHPHVVPNGSYGTNFPDPRRLWGRESRGLQRELLAMSLDPFVHPFHKYLLPANKVPGT